MDRMLRREFTYVLKLDVYFPVEGRGVRGHSGSCLRLIIKGLSAVMHEREAAAVTHDKSLKTHMNILAHIYTNTKTFSAHKQNIHAIHSQRPSTPPSLHKPPHIRYISATVCRGRSRVITSVRQEIPLCGWRLTNTQGATPGVCCCPLRLFSI